MRNFKRFLSMMLAMAMLMVWMPTVGAVSEETKLPAQEQQQGTTPEGGDATTGGKTEGGDATTTGTTTTEGGDTTTTEGGDTTTTGTTTTEGSDTTTTGTTTTEGGDTTTTGTTTTEGGDTTTGGDATTTDGKTEGDATTTDNPQDQGTEGTEPSGDTPVTEGKEENSQEPVNPDPANDQGEQTQQEQGEQTQQEQGQQEQGQQTQQEQGQQGQQTQQEQGEQTQQQDQQTQQQDQQTQQPAEEEAAETTDPAAGQTGLDEEEEGVTVDAANGQATADNTMVTIQKMPVYGQDYSLGNSDIEIIVEGKKATDFSCTIKLPTNYKTVDAGQTFNVTVELTGTLTDETGAVHNVQGSKLDIEVPVTVQPKSLTIDRYILGSRTYDGNSYTVADTAAENQIAIDTTRIISGTVNGDTATVSLEGARYYKNGREVPNLKDAGTYIVLVQGSSISISGNRNNYTIDDHEIVDNADYDIATLTINRKPINITATPVEPATYSGSDQSRTVTYAADGLVNGEKLDTSCVTATVTGKNAGTYYPNPTWKITNASEEVTTGNYTIVVAEDAGKFVIEPYKFDAYVSGIECTVQYNGTKQSLEKTETSAVFSVSIRDSDKPAYDVSNIRMKTDAESEAKAEGTEVGTYSTPLQAAWFENTDTNFEVTFIPDSPIKLVIDPLDIRILEKADADGYVAANKFQFVYDGKEHFATYEAKAKKGNADIVALPDGFTVKAGGSEALTSSTVTNVTGEAGVSVSLGELTVEYNGAAVPSSQYTINTDVVAQTKVIVNKRPLHIGPTKELFTFEYDGKQHFAEFEVKEDDKGMALPTGMKLDPNPLQSAEFGMMVANYTLVPATFKILDASNAEINLNNFAITADKAKLTITPKAVTVTVNDATKVYGEDDPAFTATLTGLVEDESEDLIQYSIDRAEDDKDKENAGDDITLKATGEAAQGNYAVTYETGKLTITKRPAAIKAIDAGKFYDGTPLTAVDYEEAEGDYTEEQVAAGVGVVNDDEFTVTTTPESTITDVLYEEDEAGELQISSSGVANIIDTVDGNKVTYDAEGVGTVETANYTLTVYNGSLIVSPVWVTLTANSAEKVYDATALTDDGFTLTDGEMVGEDAFTVEMTPESTITDVGSVSNTIATVTIGEETAEVKGGVDEETAQPITNYVGNYEVTIVDGTLTITPKPVTITAGDATKVYDGTELTQPAFTNTALAGTDKHTFNVAMTDASTITDVGEVKNVVGTVDGVLVETGKATKVGNYLVTTVDGKLTVTPRKVVGLELKQQEGDTPYIFTLTVTLDNGDQVELGTVDYSQLGVTFTDGNGNTYTGYTLGSDTWSGKVTGFEGETFHGVTLQAALSGKAGGNYDLGSGVTSNVVTADFKAMDASATFQNRAHQADVSFNDSLASGTLTVGSTSCPIGGKIDGDKGSVKVDVPWTGSSLIHSGTSIGGTYKDKYGNQGTIHGTVTQSSATAPITVRLNNTVVNRNNRLVTITGTAWGYETIRITVTGAGGASETTTITGSGDYDNAGSGPYNWVFTPRVGEDGDYTVTVSYDDLAGGDATVSFKVDRAVKPSVVTFKPYDYATTTVVAGVTEPNATVVLTMNGKELARGRADAQGYYRLIGEVPTEEGNEAMIGRVDRTNYLVVDITDEAGNVEHVVFDQYTHSNENYPARIVGLGKWVVDEADSENWTMATKLPQGETTVPLLLGGVYKVGELKVNRNGGTVTASYTLDESIVTDEMLESVDEQLLVFGGMPTLAEVKDGASEDKKCANLANGGSVTLDVADDAAIWLVTNIDIVVKDIDEMLYQTANQPFDFSNSPLYIG